VIKYEQWGMDKWRYGMPRFAEQHSYAALLISYHAFWLHVLRVAMSSDPAFRHPLHEGAGSARLDGEEGEATRSFLGELQALQSDLRDRIGADAACAAWLAPEHLDPHVCLLQLLNALSLSLCAAVIPLQERPLRDLGEGSFDLLEVPRGSWADQVTITVRSQGEGQIVCRSYPFDFDPLPITVKAVLWRGVVARGNRSRPGCTSGCRSRSGSLMASPERAARRLAHRKVTMRGQKTAYLRSEEGQGGRAR